MWSNTAADTQPSRSATTPDPHVRLSTTGEPRGRGRGAWSATARLHAGGAGRGRVGYGAAVACRVPADIGGHAVDRGAELGRVLRVVAERVDEPLQPGVRRALDPEL